MAKEALWRAGRPGMCTNQVISATTEYGQFGGFGIKGGFDPATSIAVALGPGELATSYSTLHKVVHSVNCGSMLSMGCPSLIGGSSGSPEGAALTQIAGTLLQFAVHEAHFSGGSTTDIRYGGTTGREALWSTSVAKQAVSRNTRVLGKGIMSQRGGPCTEMLLYECAVAMMDVSASGVSYVSTPRSAGGQYTDYLTPLECKFCGEVVKRSAGMTRKKVNEIAKVLIPKYEDKLLDPPKGQSFRECYDLKTLTPTQEWLDIYLKVKKELIEFGVPLD